MITIGIDPTIEIAPITIAWHGLMIAVGILVGDVINASTTAPRPSSSPGVRNTHPDGLTPTPELAYHSGGLYEVLIGALVFVVAWTLRARLRRPLALTWLVLALLAVARFLEFFLRSDSTDSALGLEIAQWTSLALLAVAATGAWLTLRPQAPPRRPASRRRQAEAPRDG